MAAESLKRGRGSGASGSGRRAAAAPNMHSLATAAVSGWAFRPGPRPPPQPRVSACSPRSPRRARRPAPPAPRLRGPGPPPRRARTVAELTPHFSLGSALAASCAAYRVLFRPRGLVPRPSASLAAGTGHSLIPCADQQLVSGAGCVPGGGGDDGEFRGRSDTALALGSHARALCSGKEMASSSPHLLHGWKI